MTASASHAFNPNHLDDASIVQALAQGEHGPVLQAFFGPLFGELSALANRAVATPINRHAPVVYLLPGLLGSKLGTVNARTGSLLWLDPLALINGRLDQLAIGRRRSLRALGMMLPGYLKLQLELQIAGYQVRVHAYDWRRSMIDLGKQFAAQLLTETAEVMVVAHSMGGLVARAALNHAGGARVTRLVQLGTPNQGSFALAQVLRACYPTVRKLGSVDQLHSAELLTRQVFSSFQSFYEMLPPATASNGLNLFDITQWPRDALMPKVERLKQGRRLTRHLAAADRRCHVIAGIDQPTVCSLRREQDEFIFQYRTEGDGTVPVALAQWQGARHWYVSESHGQLPRSSEVCKATIDILNNETTQRLTSHYQPREHAVIEKREAELRAVLNGKVRWDQLPMNERRDLLEPVVSPVFASLCHEVEQAGEASKA